MMTDIVDTGQLNTATREIEDTAPLSNVAVSDFEWHLDEPFLELLLRSAEEILTDRQYQILLLRYGFLDGETQTLASIGSQFGVSRERIRQIEMQLVRRLKTSYRSQKRGDVALRTQIQSYVRDCLCIDTEGAVERMVAFANQELHGMPRAMTLVLHLIYQRDADIHIQAYEEYLRTCAVEFADQVKYERKRQKLLTLLNSVIWPPHVQHYTRDSLCHITQQRAVSYTGAGHAGTFFSQKLQESVEYESQMEMFFYQRIDAIDDVVWYQVQPFAIEYEWYGTMRQYYPDVLMLLNDGYCVVVEVKGRYDMGLHVNLSKWSALRTFCMQQGYGLLVTDGRIAIQDLVRYPVDESTQQLVLNALECESLSWNGYKALREQCDLQWLDFVSIILKHRLIWKLRPFTVSKRQ